MRLAGGLVAGGFRIIGFALLGLGWVALEYPWWVAGFVSAVTALWLYGKRLERARIAGLDVACMSPGEFEEFCAGALRDAGWSVRRIGASGDQGVDLIASMRGVRAAIQCKRYAGRAGNAAVQQAAAGRRFHGCRISAVVSPNGYTRAAEQLAHANGVLLLSQVDLPRLAALARIPGN